jgi:hypothetical protein
MERRTRRSHRIHEALSHFLESLCLKRAVEAVALTTHDGFLVAGHGAVDVELMGALGAASQRMSLPFQNGIAHVSRFEVNDTELYLTTLGTPVRDDSALGSLTRILAV